MRVWITKYALTRGIFAVQAEVCTGIGNNGHMISQTDPKPKYGGIYYHGRGCNWHETEEGAKAKAEQMRLDALEKLNKKMKKLRLMQF